mmetsp:Transcript_104403/g.223198  ORF Transcript_104403/g.223198 Transcript_104403/m.223198 type:complete len:155 (+) Transcript_104403:95-559(+)
MATAISLPESVNHVPRSGSMCRFHAACPTLPSDVAPLSTDPDGAEGIEAAFHHVCADVAEGVEAVSHRVGADGAGVVEAVSHHADADDAEGVEGASHQEDADGAEGVEVALHHASAHVMSCCPINCRCRSGGKCCLRRNPSSPPGYGGDPFPKP